VKLKSSVTVTTETKATSKTPI